METNLSESNKRQYVPKPDSLEKALATYRGIHPRLFLDTDKVSELKSVIYTSHAGFWKEFLEKTELILQYEPRAYDEKASPHDEWQRMVGNNMVNLAIRYILSGEKEILEATKKWVLTCCEYPNWGRACPDLAAGHMLFSVALIYDWCYDDLSYQEREKILNTLKVRGKEMAAAASEAYWKDFYLQNHLWINICGLAAAGLAIYDEYPDAREWLEIAIDKYSTVMTLLGDDGASQEGVMYWSYGLEWLLKYMDMVRKFFAVDYYSVEWFKKTALYRLYMSFPQNCWGSLQRNYVNFADAWGYDSTDFGALLRRMAKEYSDGHAQWLAGQLDKVKPDLSEVNLFTVDYHLSPWLNLIWYDPTVEPVAPTGLPTLHHFQDMDIVSARSGWSGNEALIALRCGPYIGYRAFTSGRDVGGAHVHPDANHFVLVGNGEVLLRDEGYAHKYTKYHSTLLIDGKGQMGEGSDWFIGVEPQNANAKPHIMKAITQSEYDYIVGDATDAYAKATGLRKFVRHFILIKPDVLVIVDDIETDKPCDLELRFFTGPQEIQRLRAGEYQAVGDRTALSIQLLTDEGIHVDTIQESIKVGHGDRKSYRQQAALQLLSRQQTFWKNAVAFSWSDRGTSSEQIGYTAQGSIWTFHTGKTHVTLDLEGQTLAAESAGSL
jgi:hypothetical protein